jgi:hypothetical protein
MEPGLPSGQFASAALANALAARRLASEHPAWGILRANNGPVALAIIDANLGGEIKRQSAAAFYDNVDADLEELRAHGFELPQTAIAYVRDWLSAGYLVRRPDGERQELFEASEGSLAAIRFVEQLIDPRTSVTESRLTTIVDSIYRLALETDPDVSRRIAALTQERDNLARQILALENGQDFAVLENDRAIERALDVLALAAELPEDFARVRSAIESLNRELRAKLIQEPKSRGAVLDDIFRGVDLLASSDAGKSFAGFHTLVLNPEKSTGLETQLSDILNRPFANDLTLPQRVALGGLLPTMQSASAEIHQVMTTFSRSLRRFVQTEELAEGRVVHRQVKDALALANSVAEVANPIYRMGLELKLTSLKIGSVAALKFHNPSDNESTEMVRELHGEAVDLSLLRAIVRESEIDIAELKTAVNSTLSALGSATIAEVLKSFPATQGVASIVGLILLAEDHANRTGAQERVSWNPRTNHQSGEFFVDDDGDVNATDAENQPLERSALIPQFLFEEEIA